MPVVLRPVVAALAIGLLLLVQVLTDIFTLVAVPEDIGYQRYYDSNWLAACLIPEIVLILAIAVAAMRRRKIPGGFWSGAKVGFCIAAASVFLVPLLAKPTHYRILHGIPWLHAQQPAMTFGAATNR